VLEVLESWKLVQTTTTFSSTYSLGNNLLSYCCSGCSRLFYRWSQVRG